MNYDKEKQIVEEIRNALTKRFGYFPSFSDNESEVKKDFDEVLLPFKQSGKIKDGILTLRNKTKLEKNTLKIMI